MNPFKSRHFWDLPFLIQFSADPSDEIHVEWYMIAGVSVHQWHLSGVRLRASPPGGASPMALLNGFSREEYPNGDSYVPGPCSWSHPSIHVGERIISTGGSGKSHTYYEYTGLYIDIYAYIFV